MAVADDETTPGKGPTTYVGEFFEMERVPINAVFYALLTKAEWEATSVKAEVIRMLLLRRLLCYPRTARLSRL